MARGKVADKAIVGRRDVTSMVDELRSFSPALDRDDSCGDGNVGRLRRFARALPAYDGSTSYRVTDAIDTPIMRFQDSGEGST